MDSPLIILGVALIAVVLALGLAWVPARMIILAVGRSVGEQVRELVRRSRDRRRRPRGTPERRDKWSPGDDEEG